MRRGVQGGALAGVALLALVACSSSPTLSSVSGVVVDGRTHRPVAGAAVTSGTMRTQTDASGAFTLHDVPKRAELRISARNHRGRSVSAATKLETLSLAPIPVTGTLTSQLDGRGLKGVVRTPDGRFGTAADGRFTAYGVGPGMTITASVRGYVDAQGVVAPHRTAELLMRPEEHTARSFDLPLIRAYWQGETAAAGAGGSAGILGLEAYQRAHRYFGGWSNDYANDCGYELSGVRTTARIAFALDEGTVTRLSGTDVGDRRDARFEAREYVMYVTETVAANSFVGTVRAKLVVQDGTVFTWNLCF